LGLQSVHQQREIHIITRRAVLAAVAPQRDELVLHDELRVIQQPSDESGLAVVHRTAGEAMQRAETGGEPGLGCGHQKYPSRFFFAIEAASSLSMSLPERSEVRATTISSMISSSVAAVLSIAADSG